MKKLFFLLLLLLTAHISPAQQVPAARNTFYIDGSSHGAYYSVNYDRIFRTGRVFSNSFRLGFSVFGNTMALPLGINFIKGPDQHHVELGITVVPLVEKYQKLFSAGNIADKKLYLIPGAGYRYQPPAGGFFFKAILAPIIYLDPASDNFWRMYGKVYPGINLGAGYSF